jgi:hypothetical protein
LQQLLAARSPTGGRLTRPTPNNIANLIDRDIGQSGFPQHFSKSLRALFFAERRRWNFSQFDQVAPRLRFDRDNVLHCGLHAAIAPDGRNFCCVPRLHFGYLLILRRE